MRRGVALAEVDLAGGPIDDEAEVLEHVPTEERRQCLVVRPRLGDVDLGRKDLDATVVVAKPAMRSLAIVSVGSAHSLVRDLLRPVLRVLQRRGADADHGDCVERMQAGASGAGVDQERRLAPMPG